MISVLLQGRTGNNLFQYAVGRALADRLDTDLTLDGSWAPPKLAQQFESIFEFPLRACYRRSGSLPKRVLRKVAGVKPTQLHRGEAFVEKSTGFDPAVMSLPDGTLLMGYFQAPDYAGMIEEALRVDLDLKAITLSESGRRLEDLLCERPTVSVHVRRGDYLGIPSTQCLAANYHQRALDWFRARMENLRFCLFSDDIEWCRQTFQGPEFIFSDVGDTQLPLQDLRLMATCSHHIIVNSSFSWWGAWLNPCQRKRVLVPETWMAKLQSFAVVPEDWTIIENDALQGG